MAERARAARPVLRALALSCVFPALAGPWPPPPETGGQVVLPSGAILQVEVADDPEELRRGLKGRAELPADRGMLFVLAFEGTHRFYMKDCLVPLDILWLDRHGRVLHLERDLPPCHDADEACPRFGPEVPARFVLELRAGGAAAHRLEKGSLLLVDLGGR